MIKIRSRIRSRSANGTYIIERKLAARLFNTVLAILLGAAVLFALINGESSSLAGNLIFALVFLVTVYNAGENRLYIFDLQNNTLKIEQRFLGLRLKKTELPLKLVQRVILDGVEFDVHSKNRKNPGIYKLQLRLKQEPAEGTEAEEMPAKLTIEDSTDQQELTAIGNELAQLLQVEYETSSGL